MNDTIIENHNKRVKPGDTVFYVGDFCFRNSPGGKKGEGEIQRADYYLKKMNGNFIFIKGNHDKNNSVKTIIERLIINHGGVRINLVHNPEFANINYDLNLVGHVHQLWKTKRVIKGMSFTDCINVGVDVWKFFPVNFDEIISEWRKWKKSIIQ